MALTEYDKKNLTKEQQKAIQEATSRWEAANAKGDKAGMDSAAADAKKIRSSAGYTTDSSGKYTGSTSSVGGGSSNKGTNKNNQYTNVSWDANTDYQAIINDAVLRGDYIAAAMAEQQRNAKILGTGSSYAPTYYYQSYINGKNNDFTYDEAKPTYEGKYDEEIERMLKKILNRDDFSYDVENDPLYEQYSKMYRREGDRARRETLADAAASAGGMNSSAITVAQQAQNYYNSQLNDRIPELYQLAYDMYLKDKERQVQDLGLLHKMDESQYNRFRDTMYDWQNDRSFAYGEYQDDVRQNNFNTTMEYNNMQNVYNDAWRNKEWETNQTRYDQDLARKEVEAAIAAGVIPDAETVRRAGMNPTEVNLRVAAVQAEMQRKNTKKGGSDYVDDFGVDDIRKPIDTGNGYTNEIGLGIGPVDYETLSLLAEEGAILVDENDNFKWADGYGKHNWLEVLAKAREKSNKSIYPSLSISSILSNLYE